MIIIKTTAFLAADVIESMNNSIRRKFPLLNEQVGIALVEDVRKRIKTADNNRWAKPSKWLRAKKDATRVLVGAERFVRYKAYPSRVTIYDDTGAGWTLSQHDRGFRNVLAKDEELVGNHVRLEIINPAPLGLKKAGPFFFVPKRAGMTPARKIWPTEAETAKIIGPIASRWLKKIISETSGVRP